MFIYYARRYEATVSGSALRRVVCEKCGHSYTYTLSRTIHASATSPYGLNNEGAAKDASTEARARLASELRDGLDIVPCPQCGMIQSYMARESALRERLRKDGRGNYIFLLLIFLSFIAVWMGLRYYDDFALEKAASEIEGELRQPALLRSFGRGVSPVARALASYSTTPTGCIENCRNNNECHVLAYDARTKSCFLYPLIGPIEQSRARITVKIK